MRWFAYNGDADGICSMVQWGLVHGIEGHRITGVKRDIRLLDRITPQVGDDIVVMDISLARNHDLASALSQEHPIRWFDHHLAGEKIEAIECHINTGPNVCTARMVESYLGVESDWAQVALHGDGLSQHSTMPEFKELGELLNYNGYGSTLSDLHIHPDELMLACLQAGTPQQFMQTEVFANLRNGFAMDMEKSASIKMDSGIHMLPDEPWARRVVGVLAHRINESGSGPHVIAIDKGETLQVSLRGQQGIGELASMFGGGGRATAGGIDSLPKGEVTALMNEVNARRTT